MEHILAYDIGGTYIKFGVFTGQGQLLAKGRFAAGHGDDLIPAITGHYDQIAAQYKIIGIGIGIPGLIKQGVIRAAVNLGLTDVPLRQSLENQLDLPVAIANDASLAAIGEKYFGQVSDLDNFLMVTIGTGIGTGIILEGRSFEGHHGAFGELGHTVVEKDGRACSCGNRGCLEMYVSIKGLVANYLEHWAEPIEIADLIGRGDEKTRAVLDASARQLGFALANAVTLLDLEQVVLGGGLSEIPYLVERTAYWVDHYVLPLIRPVAVIKASLGNDAALYGAYQYFISKPSQL